jgi:hypothetical protein
MYDRLNASELRRRLLPRSGVKGSQVQILSSRLMSSPTDVSARQCAAPRARRSSAGRPTTTLVNNARPRELDNVARRSVDDNPHQRRTVAMWPADSRCFCCMTCA